jgi:uncharacterized protein DUF4189
MERAGRTDQSSGLGALVAGALVLATTALMVVTFTTARAAGVIATGACGAYGQAYDSPTMDAARKSALAKCSGANCKVVAQVKHGCSAFAVDGSNPCGAAGWASGAKLGRAQNDALKACYKAGGKDCVIRTFLCDAKG